MSVAQKFLEELKSGRVDEAIETIKAGLKESTDAQIQEKRNELLDSYGFAPITEQKDGEEGDEEDKEEQDDDESEDDKEDE